MSILDTALENIDETFSNGALGIIQQNIVKFGLTENQSKVFLYLSKNGSKSASEISKSIKLPRTETYRLLNILQNKGIVISIIGKPTKFQAQKFDDAIMILINSEKNHVKELEKQKQELVSLWKTVPKNNDTVDKEDNKFQTLQGKSSIVGKLKHMVESSKGEIVIFGSESDFVKLYHTDFLQHLKKVKSKIRILTSNTVKKDYLQGIPTNQIRKFEESNENKLCFVINDNSEMILLIETTDDSEMLAMWSDSKSFIHSLRLLFDLSWGQANYSKFEYEHRLKEIEQETLIINNIYQNLDKLKQQSIKK